MWRQLLRFRTIVLPNLRDAVLTLGGFFQSVAKLILWRPDVIFIKGGYVCLPVGIAAHMLRIPYVIHDSDVHPGLTNRVLAKWAVKIATGAPLEHYKYPRDRAVYVGIPVDSAFHTFTPAQKKEAKERLSFVADKPLITVTGGGLGAQTINDAIVAILDELLPFASVMLICGTAQFKDLKEKTRGYDSSSFQLHAFISGGMAEALGAADVVVTRAGATTLLELAALGAPAVLVPNPYLTGGHQLKNADVYRQRNAAVILDEERVREVPHDILDALVSLIHHREEQKRLSKAIRSFAKPDAAKDVAKLLVAAVDSRRGKN